VSASLQRATLQALSDENLAEFVRHIARHGEGTVINEQNGLLLVAGSHPQPGPYRNFAMRLTDELDAPTSVDRATSFFRERSRGFIFWVRQHADRDIEEIATWDALEQEGLPQFATTEPLEESEPAFGVRLCYPSSDEERKDFLMVNAAGWGLEGMPYDLARHTLFEPSILEAPNVIASLAYLHDEPASTCMSIITSGGVAGGYWGATAQFARRLGLSSLTTAAIFNRAFERGCEVAVCQSSQMNQRNILRLGFTEISRYKRYLVV
jgi:hypothetical protein